MKGTVWVRVLLTWGLTRARLENDLEALSRVSNEGIDSDCPW